MLIKEDATVFVIPVNSSSPALHTPPRVKYAGQAARDVLTRGRKTLEGVTREGRMH